MTPERALSIAIKEAGGPAAVSKALTCTSQAVSQWKRAPAARVKQLAEMSGGKVSVHDLRPDIFGASEQAAA